MSRPEVPWLSRVSTALRLLGEQLAGSAASPRDTQTQIATAARRAQRAGLRPGMITTPEGHAAITLVGSTDDGGATRLDCLDAQWGLVVDWAQAQVARGHRGEMP